MVPAFRIYRVQRESLIEAAQRLLDVLLRIREFALRRPAADAAWLNRESAVDRSRGLFVALPARFVCWKATP